jgi:hypothetical protein
MDAGDHDLATSLTSSFSFPVVSDGVLSDLVRKCDMFASRQSSNCLMRIASLAVVIRSDNCDDIIRATLDPIQRH